MKELPRDIDWPALVGNIQAKARLFKLISVARAADVDYNILRNIVSGRTLHPDYRTVAPLINMHMKIAPGMEIPERST